MQLEIKINEEENRFETYVEGLIAEIKYVKPQTGTLAITSTNVPKSLEGKGIAGAITKFALDYARENGLKVNPICTYTAAYIKKHPEYKDLADDLASE